MTAHIINLNERRQQRMRARHNIGDHAATLRALDAEAIEGAACTARARAFEASERAILRDAYETVRTRHVAKVFAMPLKADNPLVTTAKLRAHMDALIARPNPYTNTDK